MARCGKVGPDGIYSSHLGMKAVDVKICGTHIKGAVRRGMLAKKREYSEWKNNAKFDVQFVFLSIWGNVIDKDTSDWLKTMFTSHSRRLAIIEFSVALVRELSTQLLSFQVHSMGSE